MIRTISQAIDEYIKVVASARSANTGRTYNNAMNAFRQMLIYNQIQPESTAILELPENSIVWFISALKN